MTQTIEYKQHSHLDPALSDPATRTLSAHKVTGRWLNTNRETSGIAECVIEQDGEQFTVALVGEFIEMAVTTIPGPKEATVVPGSQLVF